MCGRDLRAIDHAPNVYVEQTSVVGVGHLVQAPEDADAGVVDPSVEAAELADGDLRDGVQVGRLGHVCHHVGCFAASVPDPRDGGEQGGPVTGGKHDAGALLRHKPSRGRCHLRHP